MLNSDSSTWLNNLLSRSSRAEQTIIFAPGLPWDGGMFQRPQQLARALARSGALVLYVQPNNAWPHLMIEVE